MLVDGLPLRGRFPTACIMHAQSRFRVNFRRNPVGSAISLRNSKRAQANPGLTYRQTRVLVSNFNSIIQSQPRYRERVSIATFTASHEIHRDKTRPAFPQLVCLIGAKPGFIHMCFIGLGARLSLRQTPIDLYVRTCQKGPLAWLRLIIYTFHSRQKGC